MKDLLHFNSKIAVPFFVACAVLCMSFGAVAEQKYDLNTESLIGIIEAYLKDHQDEKSLPVSNLHLALARYYIHSGRIDKANAHLASVSVSSDKVNLLEPYAGMILEAAARKDDEGVVAIVNQNQSIFEEIHAIGFEKGDWGNHEPDQKFVNKTLCGFALKAFAAAGELVSLEKVAQLPQCTELSFEAVRLRLAALLANKEYKKAYEFVASRNEQKPANAMLGAEAWMYNPSVRVFGDCLSDNAIVSISSEDQKYLLQQKDAQLQHPEDNKAYFLAFLLRKSGNNDAAYQLSQKISEPFLRTSALRASYNDFYLAANRDKFMDAAKQLDVFGAPPASGPPNAWPPTQWYATTIAEVVVLKNHPTPLAYELVMKMKNDKTRFVSLLALYQASKDKNISMPGCKDTLFECVEKELSSVASKESDDFARDFMYGRIVDLQKEAGHDDAAKKIFSKIKAPDQFVCYYDMCQNGFVASPGPTKADCAKKPDDVASVSCRYMSGAYLQDLENPKLTGAARDSYIKELVPMLERDKKYSDLINAASKFSDPTAAEETVFRAWQRVARLHLDFGFLERDPDRFSRRTEFIDDLLKNPTFAKSDALWERIVNDVEFAYWNGFYLGSGVGGGVTPAQKKQGTEEVWNLVADIRSKRPGIKYGDCAPAKLGHFPKECEARRLIAQGKNEDALRLVDDPSNKMAFAMVANIIIFERFVAGNKNYRNATNSGFLFSYATDMGSGCPVSSPDK